MSGILTQSDNNFPFEWVNTSSYRDSNAFRCEIYLKNQQDMLDSLITLFYSLFGKFKDKLLIYNKSWWDFCLDTWDIEKDEYNYDLRGKSDETQEYLKILKEAKLPLGYSGCCTCTDWDRFLSVMLTCIISHRAPYSHLFCEPDSKIFFYFHYTGSIGIYYKEESSVIKHLLFTAQKAYDIRE